MSELITQTTVLSREGWSKSILIKLLGEPDARKKIRGYTNLACLYCLDRVLAAESSEYFAAAQVALNKRKASAKKAVQTKTERLLAEVASMSVSVGSAGKKRVLRMAIDAYNMRNFESYDPATPCSDKSFLDRICVNFIRHEMTEYDRALEEIAGRTGIGQAVDAVRVKIYDAISIAYPELMEECQKQLAARRGQDCVIGLASFR